MKLIIVDDHSLFRSGLVTLFNSQADFEVVGEAGTAKGALALLDTQCPDLVLMDLGLPDVEGPDLIPRMLQKRPDIQIVVLTVHASDETAFACIRLGAKGFLIKDISAQALLKALRGIERGELAVSRSILSRFVAESIPMLGSRNDRIGKDTALTLREIEVLTEIADGMSNGEIAHRLSISQNTVKVHVHNILKKLNLSSRQEAASYARRLGLRSRLKEFAAE